MTTNFISTVKLSCGCRMNRDELSFQLKKFQLKGNSLGLEGAYCYLRFNDKKKTKIRPLCLICKRPMQFRDFTMIDPEIAPNDFHTLEQHWNSLDYDTNFTLSPLASSEQPARQPMLYETKVSSRFSPREPAIQRKP